MHAKLTGLSPNMVSANRLLAGCGAGPPDRTHNHSPGAHSPEHTRIAEYTTLRTTLRYNTVYQGESKERSQKVSLQF